MDESPVLDSEIMHAISRDDNRVARQCIDPPQSLIVIESGLGRIETTPAMPAQAASEHLADSGGDVALQRAPCVFHVSCVVRNGL